MWYGNETKNDTRGQLNKTQLFTEEFCHPAPGMNYTNASNWYMCPTQASREDCPSYCAFTNGAEMIPANDFCAPQNITQNVTAIVSCARADQYSCGDYWNYNAYQCRMYRGKEVANNTYQGYYGDKLFESNFCHPPTTYDWNEKAPRCLNYTDGQSCSMNQCVWSTGKGLMPQNASFCLPRWIS